jgi:hypothetical protein
MIRRLAGENRRINPVGRHYTPISLDPRAKFQQIRASREPRQPDFSEIRRETLKTG